MDRPETAEMFQDDAKLLIEAYEVGTGEIAKRVTAAWATR